MATKKDQPDGALPAVTRPAWFGKASRDLASSDDLKKAAEMIEDDPGHAKNGWTPETLATYFKERERSNSDTILHRRPEKPKRTNGWHNAHRWRR